MRTTIQILFDRGLFDGFHNAAEVSKDFLFLTRRRGDLGENKRSFLKIFLIITFSKKNNIKYEKISSLLFYWFE